MSFICIWRSVLLILACLSCTITADSSLYCVTHSSKQTNYREVVSICPTITSTTTVKSRPISAAISNQFNETDAQKTSSQNAIQIDLVCLAESDVCKKVEATMAEASKVITSAFRLETPLRVNASYFNFCQYFNDCPVNTQASIAQTYPTISYVMIDLTDNMTRMYPQPLLKQFTNLTTKPTWSTYDIEAQFNSETNWYFQDDVDTINSNQTDFLANVIHELIHGLGLMTSWRDVLYNGLSPLFPDNVLEHFITPSLLASMDNPEPLTNYSTPIPFWGFVEFAFDKFLAYKTKRYDTTDGTAHPLSSITNRLNRFARSNALFQSAIDLANAWYHSEEYSHAQRLYNRAITALEMLTIVNDEPVFWVESSLVPFSPGSSLCHVDQSQYLNTSDSLMTYSAKQGFALITATDRYPYGPIGPRLAKMMAALGYRMDPKYAANTTRPPLQFWSPPPDLAGTDSNPTPTLNVDRNGPARSPPTQNDAPASATTLAGVSPPTSESSKTCLIFYQGIFVSLSVIITTLYL